MAARYGDRLPGLDRGCLRDRRRAGLAGTDLLRGAQIARSRWGREPRTLCHDRVRPGWPRARRLANWFHRRSRLRIVDRPVRRRAPLGPPDGGRAASRHPPDGLGRAGHGAHRGRLHRGQRRIFRRRPGDPPGPAAFAVRDRPRMAGRLRQGQLRRPPGLAARARNRLALRPGRPRYRRQQAGGRFVHLPRQGHRGRHRDLGDVVAVGQTQHRSRLTTDPIRPARPRLVGRRPRPA